MRLALRFLELQIPMALGAGVCYLLGGWVRASTGLAPVYYPGSVLYFLGDLLFLVAPVGAWMLLRGFDRGTARAMAFAMLAPVAVIVLVGGARFDVLRWLVDGMYPAMSLGMIALLLARRRAFEAQPSREAAWRRGKPAAAR